LLARMCWLLRREVEHFQVKETIYLTDIEKKLASYHEKAELINAAVSDPKKKVKAMNEGVLKRFAILQQDYSADEIWKRGIMSRSAVYDARRRLKAIGITGHHIGAVTIDTGIEFDRYHKAIFNNHWLKTHSPFL